MRTRKRVSINWIFFLLICVLGIVESATDIYVPSLPSLVTEFGASEKTVGFTVSAYYFAFCIMGPVYGPLSDALGRRRILIFGVSIFTFFSLMCGFAVDAGALTICRFLQGMGGSVAWILGLAIIKDIYSSRESVRMLSSMGTVVAVAPGLAPVLGGYITTFWGWRAIFWTVGAGAFLTLLGLWWHLDETLPRQKRHRLNLKVALHNYRHLLRNSCFLGYICISGLMFSGIMANVTITPFYYIRQLGVPLEKYGYFQMILIVAYMLGTYVNRKALRKWPSRSLLYFGICFALGGASLLWLLTALYPAYPWLLTGGMSFYSFGAGISFSNTSNQALEIFPQAGGASAALLTVFEMTCVGIAVWIAGLIYAGSFLPIAICVWCCACLCLLILMRLRRLETRQAADTP